MRPILDFVDHEMLSDQVIDELVRLGKYAPIDPAARKHVVENSDFLTGWRPEHISRINSLSPEGRQVCM